VLDILSLLLAFILPILAGPTAGLVFVRLLKRGKGWHQIPFWGLLVVLNLLVAYWMVVTSNEWIPVAGMAACLFTPVAAILTLLAMGFAWRRLQAAGGTDPARKSWFTVGLVLIPALQMGLLAALVVVGPALCTWAHVVCKDW
jgi:hypothetical protein